MEEKNRSMKFLMWQTQKIGIVAVFAPIIYVLLLNIMDGNFSMTEGIGQFMPYVVFMFGIVVMISYSFSLSKTIVPLAMAMGSTRREVISSVIFANLFLALQIFAMYIITDIIFYGNFLERIGFILTILGIIIAFAGIQNYIITGMLLIPNNMAIVIITVVLAMGCGFAAGFFTVTFSDVEFNMLVNLKCWISIIVIAVASVFYLGSVYFLMRKTERYQVVM